MENFIPGLKSNLVQILIESNCILETLW